MINPGGVGSGIFGIGIFTPFFYFSAEDGVRGLGAFLLLKKNSRTFIPVPDYQAGEITYGYGILFGACVKAETSRIVS